MPLRLGNQAALRLREFITAAQLPFDTDERRDDRGVHFGREANRVSVLRAGYIEHWMIYPEPNQPEDSWGNVQVPEAWSAIDVVGITERIRAVIALAAHVFEESEAPGTPLYVGLVANGLYDRSIAELEPEPGRISTRPTRIAPPSHDEPRPWVEDDLFYVVGQNPNDLVGGLVESLLFHQGYTKYEDYVARVAAELQR